MPKSKRPELLDANLTIPQIKAALLKLERRIDELKQVKVESLSVNDPSITALEKKLDSFLSDTFGSNTVEYNRYRSIRYLYQGSINLMRGTSELEYREGVSDGLREAIAILESIQSDFNEKLADAGQGIASKAIRAYEGLELHPEIEKASGQLFRDGHYANAVEDAVKALTQQVKSKSGINDDGVSLMQHVFSAKNPVLRFNDLKDESDKSEQLGFMHLFSGAVAGVRNPRAHKIIKDEPERALEFIGFISLLAKLVDESKT